SGNAHVIHKAGKVLVSPWQIIENGCIHVENDIIVDVWSEKSGNAQDAFAAFNSNCGVDVSSCVVEVIDHGPGILMPALVNAHTHFELSAMKGRISFDRGFNGWVRELLKQRDACGIDMLRQEAGKSILTAVASGTSLFGEISTLGITEDIFADSDIRGVWFQECLGTEEPFNISRLLSRRSHSNRSHSDRSHSHQHLFFDPPETLSSSVSMADHASTHLLSSVSIAGHAPHTTSPELLKMLKQHTKAANLPFSIHVAESCDETEFITTTNTSIRASVPYENRPPAEFVFHPVKSRSEISRNEIRFCSKSSKNYGQGQWAQFLRQRGIDFSSWPVPSRSSVQYLYDMGILDPLTLAVHLLDVDIEDIEIIAKTGAKPVFCPRSNFNLHKKLPDIPLFLQCGLKPALGSDSLASTETLNMFDEMAFVAEHFPQINPCDILAMATVNGADALGHGKTAGTLEKGKRADFLYIPLITSGCDINSIIMDIIATKASTGSDCC
ncbi:MAG: amidohydrolase family protein, partial [Desulfamplus sp.]|nr:amidohydrolase family protein [Desulfamplus sp.]